MLVFPSLKCFTHRLTLLAHISIHMMKSVVNISSRNLLLDKKFNDGTLMKQNVVSHFVSLVYRHVMQATDAHTSLKDTTIVGTTYQTILNRLMLQIFQLRKIAHGFRYDPRIMCCSFKHHFLNQMTKSKKGICFS